jgi:hypothetical protein
MAKASVTSEMGKAGAYAHAWWRMYGDEPCEERIATSIFRVMCAVASGELTDREVLAHLHPKTGRAFFEKFA